MLRPNDRPVLPNVSRITSGHTGRQYARGSAQAIHTDKRVTQSTKLAHDLREFLRQFRPSIHTALLSPRD